MDQVAHKHPAHVGFATVAITLMAVGLAAGLEFLGMANQVDSWIAKAMSRPGFSAPVQSLNPYFIWIVTTLLALSVAVVMLNVRGGWRRLFIWVITLIITLFWVPVLLLASHKPEIGVALVALLWSGCCTMVYTMNHQMPADLTDNTNTIPNDGAR